MKLPGRTSLQRRESLGSVDVLQEAGKVHVNSGRCFLSINRWWLESRPLGVLPAMGVEAPCAPFRLCDDCVQPPGCRLARITALAAFDSRGAVSCFTCAASCGPAHASQRGFLEGCDRRVVVQDFCQTARWFFQTRPTNSTLTNLKLGARDV